MSQIHSFRGALALELASGAQPLRTQLGQPDAGALAALIARDLARLAPEAAGLDLGVVAACFDPVELLRPHWPLHRELERLLAQAPLDGEARVIVFAAHEGELPPNLCPQDQYVGGALRLVPFLLRGEGALGRALDSQFEASLLERGLAGADTALMAQHAFGVSLAHARYLTVNDLAAMTALQYENVGLGAVWPLIESALWSPTQEQWIDAPPEPLVRLCAGQARIALFDDEAWAGSVWAPRTAGDARAGVARVHFEQRQRQIAAVLQAHGLDVCFDHCALGQDPRSVLSI